MRVHPTDKPSRMEMHRVDREDTYPLELISVSPDGTPSVASISRTLGRSDAEFSSIPLPLLRARSHCHTLDSGCP